MRKNRTPLIRLHTVLLILFILSVEHTTTCPSTAQGVTTASWVQTTQSGFDKGILDNISTHSVGEITLSPGVETVSGITEPYVWCMAANVYGTTYVGTGEPGTIYKISGSDSPFVRRRATRLHRTAELHIHSIAIDSNGAVYAGASPNGIIYRIAPEGRVTIWCQLPVLYIWGLAFDSKDNLYAATGDGGTIYKINNDGKVSVLFDSPESHILSLVIDEGGNVYCGSEPKGIIYKISADGKASALYDAKEGEIHCLALDKNGNLFAGTASGGQMHLPKPSPRSPRHPEGQEYSFLDTERRIWVDETFLNGGGRHFNQYSVHSKKPSLRNSRALSRSRGKPVGYNSVYRVSREGDVEKVFEVKNAFILGLAVDDKNDLYIGTGNGSRIYKITCNETRGGLQWNKDATSTLMDVQESQVLALLACVNDGVYAGTGNNGNILKFSMHYASEGTFTSSVYDANFVSKWGRITWESDLPGSTKLTLATRTGNSSEPDSTWSNWSDEYTEPGKVINSPQARFIQYRARLSTSDMDLTPVLREVSIAYLSHNQPPSIASVVVESKRKEQRRYNSRMSAQSARSSKRGEKKNRNMRLNKRRTLYKQSIKTIYWTSADPNNDRLVHSLYYKAVDERNWKSLADGLYDTDYYTWDTSRVPDGKYLIKIVASDSPDNPPGLAISAEKVSSAPFKIDNTRPGVAGLEATVLDTNQCRVKGIARDNACVISKMQYSLDATDWISIFPDDQIFDAEEETFQLLTPELSEGEHTIVVNAFDSEGNVGSGKVVINVGRVGDG